MEGDDTRELWENDWHTVEIFEDDGQLMWRNDAGHEWSLSWSSGELWTGEDCPYGEQELELVFSEDDSEQLEGLLFQEELYVRS